MSAGQRFTSIEYLVDSEIADTIVSRTGIQRSEAYELLDRAGNRIRENLGLKKSPVVHTGEGICFQNVAGLMLLRPGLELEIAPKFLGAVRGWREDFFFLATLSYHGRLLDSEDLRAAAQQTSDLATLVGRSLVQSYWRSHRRPLRTYCRVQRNEFALEGEFDPVDLISPSVSGFPQRVTEFTRNNTYNAVIRSAALQLAPMVTDLETRARLERVAYHLPNMSRPSRIRDLILPSRSRSWQLVYDLSLDILRGFGGSYDEESALAPGFVMWTWKVWEHLVSICLRMEFGGASVLTQPVKQLGVRRVGDRSDNLNVFPDAILSITGPGEKRTVLVDAKYKGKAEEKTLGISNSDIYEVLAHSRATGVKDVFLVYPYTINEEPGPGHEVGNFNEFSSITVDDITIRGIKLGIGGISKRGGLKKVSEALKTAITTALYG